MTIRTSVTIASIAGAVAALAVIVPVRAGGDKVAFPENHAAGVLFTTVDRADNKQFREFYTSAAALDAAKKGEPLPSGTVITMLQYAAKLDAQGNPEKDANGRFIKGNLIGYAVMEKRAGWGAEYSDNVRTASADRCALTVTIELVKTITNSGIFSSNKNRNDRGSTVADGFVSAGAGNIRRRGQ